MTSKLTKTAYLNYHELIGSLNDDIIMQYEPVSWYYSREDFDLSFVVRSQIKRTEDYIPK